MDDLGRSQVAAGLDAELLSTKYNRASFYESVKPIRDFIAHLAQCKIRFGWLRYVGLCRFQMFTLLITKV